MQASLEQIALSAVESFRCLSYVVPRFPAPWHFHPEYELTYIVKSSGMRFVGDSIARFEEGDLVLVGPNLPHCWLNPEPRKGDVSASIVLQFREDFLGQQFFDAPELTPVRKLLARASRGLLFRGGTRKNVTEQMKRLPELSGGPRLLAFLAVLQELAQSREFSPLSSAGYEFNVAEVDSARMHRVYRHLFDHFTEPLRLPQIAKLAHMSPAAFCRYFKRHSGQTLTAALNEIRIGYACKLLLETELSVSEACYRSGFNNLSHFNRQFLRRTKCTPLEYRKRFGQTTLENMV